MGELLHTQSGKSLYKYFCNQSDRNKHTIFTQNGVNLTGKQSTLLTQD
jgi:hypothetical protein